MLQSPKGNEPGHQTTDTDDRRTEPRYETYSVGEVTDLSTMSPAHPAEILDVSKSGVCFRSELDVQRGVRVKIAFGDTLAFGEVRWRRQLDEHWFEAGAAIENTVRKDLVSNIRRAASIASTKQSSDDKNRE